VPETPREESDQLPEEAPSDQVPDDSAGSARDEAKHSPGVPGEEDTATGNPAAAGGRNRTTAKTSSAAAPRVGTGERAPRPARRPGDAPTV
jgi:hypothetical protein